MKPTIVQYRRSRPINLWISILSIVVLGVVLALQLVKVQSNGSPVYYVFLFLCLGLIILVTVSLAQYFIRSTIVIYEGGIFIDKNHSYSDILFVRVGAKKIQIRAKKNATYNIYYDQFIGIKKGELKEIFNELRLRIDMYEEIVYL